jgi:ribosomal protein S18 acetylase RimI-like enzyme
MSDLIIRRYSVIDLDDVIDLWVQCGLVVPQNDPKRDVERKLRVNPEWFLVGRFEGKVVASCMAGYEGHRGWINYLAVAPQYRRRGFASQIMREAERILQDVGCPKINLQVRTSNSDVIEFYKAIGYTMDDVVSLGKRLDSDQRLPE